MIGIEQDTSIYAPESRPLTLKCRVCGKEKRPDEFAKRKKGRYGLDRRCAACLSQFNKAYFQANKERAMELQRVRRAGGTDKKFGNSWQGLAEAFTQMRAHENTFSAG